MITDAIGMGSDQEIQNNWKAHYMAVLHTIKEKGCYRPPRPLHPIKRFFCYGSEPRDYILYANNKANASYIRPEVYKEVCTAYVTAFDECAKEPKKAIIIRKQLMELLNMYVRSCQSVIDLEPQRSIVKSINDSAI